MPGWHMVYQLPGARWFTARNPYPRVLALEFNLDLKTAHQHVYVKLRELILEGVIASGERLDERALSAALGVSRTPLREAVTRLVGDGLIEHHAYQGNFVRQLDVQQVADLFDVRSALEALAAETAVQRLTDEALTRIASALDSACAALEMGDMTGFAAADRSFHRIVAECSANELLIGLLENLDAQIQLVRVLANRDSDFTARTLAERAEILRAFETRKGERAAELMRRHIEDVKHTVLAQLTPDPGSDA